MGAPAELLVDLPARGVTLAVYDWGGRGPAVLCAHATGFCGRLWELVAGELAGAFRVLAFDARGHGASSRPPPPHGYGWDSLAADLVALVDALEPALGVSRLAVGVGNSMGGTTMLGAAALRPDRLAAIALVDPVVLPRSAYRGGVPLGSKLLSEGAARRRAVFPSRAAVIDAYRGRELFADWDPRALRLYAEHGFRERVDGQVELRCAPEVEAAVFAAAGSLDPFAAARELAVPGEVLAARDSFAREPYVELCALAPGLRLVPIDCGHLAPMIDPALVAARIRAVHEDACG